MNRSIWNYSFRLGRFWGTEVMIHWTLVAMMLYFVIQAQQVGTSLKWMLLGIVLFELLLFGSVLLHEFGHVFAARRFNLPAERIILTPIGGLALIGGQSRSPWAEFCITFWGPAVNLGLALIGFGLYALLGGMIDWGLLPLVDDLELLRHNYSASILLIILQSFISMNLLLFAFNVMMIAYPMDGGRMLFSVLWHFKGHGKGLYMTCLVARFVAILMGVVGLVSGAYMLAIIAFFIWFQASQTLKMLPHMPDPSYLQDNRFETLAWEQQSERQAKARARRPGPIRRLMNRWRARRAIAREEERLNTRQKVDELLAKISNSETGIAGLTDKEKEFLKQASKEYQKK